MKRGAVVGIVIAVVLVAGVGGAVIVSLADRPADPAGPADSAGTATATATGGATATPSPSGSPADAAQSPAPDATAPGEYIEYSEAALATADGTAVLFFHAPWCPQCRALDADIVARGVPTGVTILKVDYDSNQALRQRYGVTLQTTVVAVDGSGDATAIFVPYDEPTLDSALAGLGLGG